MADYVPGILQCKKCNFQLIKNTLNLGAGTMTADCSADQCPICGVPMWRVSWEEYAREIAASSDKAWAERCQYKECLDKIAQLSNSDLFYSQAQKLIKECCRTQ